MDNTSDMQMHSTTILAVVFKNLLYLLTLALDFVLNYMIAVFPDWKNFIENIKQIGGLIIIILVITKLLIEIKRLKKK